VRRVAAFPQDKNVKARPERAEWGINGRSLTSRVNWSRNRVCKPVSGFTFNRAFSPMGALYDSASNVDGSESCWGERVSFEDEVDLCGNVGNCLDISVSALTTPHELLRTSKDLEKALLQLDLQAPLPQQKTNWEVIREVHVLLKVVLTILEATVNEVSPKFESYSISTNPNGDAQCYPEDSEDNDLYEDLRRSFEEVSNTASKRCFQALQLVANFIDECQDITELAPASLLPAALVFINTYGRIYQVQTKMNVKKRGDETVADWRKEQEQRGVEHFWKPIETVSRCVITVQKRVLQSALAQPLGTATHKEKTSNLESHLQQSWTWFNRLAKRVGVLCPSRKQSLFVDLLERFIETTVKLAQYQKLLPILRHDDNRKAQLTAAASSCQRMLLQSLMQLFKRVEEAGLKLRKEEFATVFDFAQIADASQIYSITLTLLLSAVAELRGTTISQSHHFSETLQKYGTELMCFAKPCVEVIDVLASGVSH